MKKYFFIASAIVLLLLVFFGNPAVDARQKLFGEILSFFGSKQTDSQATIDSLRAENLELRGRLASEITAPTDKNFHKANIYSTYPFNTRNIIVIDVGEIDMVKKLTPVMFEGKVFLGFVDEVNKKTSLAKTIFDGSVEIKVRVGDQGIDALLKGGTTPKLTFIEKKSDVKSGDVIITADSRFPFGMAIGNIQEVRDSDTSSFKEATIQLPYVLTKLRTVYVSQ